MDHNTPKPRQVTFSGRQSGRKLARYSFWDLDKDGRLIRRWHDQVHGLGPPKAKSLLGMTKP